MGLQEKDILRPPPFEIRANQFIHHARGIKMKMSRERMGYIELYFEKWLHKLADAYMSVQELRGEDLTAEERALLRSELDNLDKQTAEQCLVNVHAISFDGKEPLRFFVVQVNKLARQMGAEQSDRLRIIQTTDSPYEIELLNDGIEGAHIFDKTFKFT